MKTMTFLLCLLTALPGWAQQRQDSLQQQNARGEGLSVSEIFSVGEKTFRKGGGDAYAPFEGHWQGFHVGFVNFANPEDEFMQFDHKRSVSLQFNLADYAIGLNKRNNFGFITGLGIEYQRLRFDDDNNMILKKNGHATLADVREVFPETHKIRRSTFKNLYLTVPVMLEVQFPAAKEASRRLFVSAGVVGGIRMHSKTKVVYRDISDDRHKVKYKGNFNAVPVKADVVARVGYRNINLWGSYTLTDMFKGGDLGNTRLYSIGFGVTI